MFRFAHAPALILLILPLVYLWWLRYRARHEAPRLHYSATSLADAPVSSWRVRLRAVPDVLRWCAWVLLIIAVARPQSGMAQSFIRGEGVDIVLALDISGSMAALDFDPQTRLEAAKAVITTFVNAREFDRIGLVVFAHDAFHHVPLTLDYGVLLRLLDEVQLAPELNLEDGTAIGLGLASAANMLRSSAMASRVIILLTDGANNAGGMPPISAAEAVAALGIRVYTIGVGRSGMVAVRAADGATQMVQSDLDEETLQTIARITEGRFFRAIDLDDLQGVYDQIDRLERSDVERQVFVQWRDLAGPVLLLSLVLLVIERVLRSGVLQVVP
jgi:Ca-activated chloride channel family protein